MSDTAKKIVTPDGFASEWRSMIAKGYTYERAYDMLEQIYNHEYGVYKYSSYQSFYQSLYQKERRQRENKTTRL